jgi:hypothetical protein
VSETGNDDLGRRDGDASNPTNRARPRRWGRVVLGLAALLLLGLALSEWFLRARFGLGQPLLVLADPQCEYRLVPDQHMVRLGNRIHVNHWSMRSDDFPKAKSDPNELRVLMVGDSVINGGVYTDQSQLVSEILAQRLSTKLGRRVIVGNASAGSWGPENIRGYLRKFGTFDADVIVLVQSTHDTSDAMPTTMPTSEFVLPYPRFAIQEALEKTIGNWGAGPATTADPNAPANNEHERPPIEKCLQAFTDIIDILGPERTLVALHMEDSEAPPAKAGPGHEVMLTLAASRGAKVIELGPAFAASRDAGHNPWRDYIHPNTIGQSVMADTIEPVLLEALRRRIAAVSSQPSTRPS